MTPAQFQLKIPELTTLLRRMISAKVRESHAVDDLVQESLLAAVQDLGTLREASKLRAWVAVIGRNRLHRYFREQRDHRWQALADEAAEAAPERRATLLEQFDGVARWIHGAGLKPADWDVLTLSFVMGWPAAEIAGHLGLKTNTVNAKLSRARHVLRRKSPAAAIDPRHDALQKNRWIGLLWSSAAFPMAGDARHNMAMLKELVALIRLTAMQYPDDPSVAFAEMLYSYFVARMDEGLTVEAMVTEDFDTWNRASWNREQLAIAEAAYARVIAKVPEGHSFRLDVEAMHDLFSPRTHEAVPWARVRANIEASLRVRPRSLLPVVLARVIAQLDGPRAGARYLEGVRRQELMRDNPRVYFTLGRLYYRARLWDKAARNLKKYLRWVKNKTWRQDLHRLIAECRAKRGS